MQYAISISYKYSLTELCILLYPFGLHRLPAPAPPEPQHWTRERLDTFRQHRSGRSTSGRSGRARRDTETAPAAEPPRDQSQKRNARRARASTTAATETRPPADTQPHQSRRDRARAREPEARHCRPRTETGRDREREEERKEERERRENDSKTPLFSPSHRTPSRSTARASPAPADTDSRRNAAFSVLLLWSMRNQRRSAPVLTIRKAGTVHIFTTSPTPKIWLCTLFSTPLSFSPNHHLQNAPFINDIFYIICYSKMLFGKRFGRIR